MAAAGLTAPAEVTETARATALRNLAVLREMRRIQTAFAAAGTDLLFLKGLTTGILAFGSPALKESWDIDILVAPGDLLAGAALLTGLGYEALPGFGGDEGVAARHLNFRESVWRHAEHGTYVELHTALADNSMLIPDIGMASPRQPVRAGADLVFPTLAPDELFAYLCFHGTASGWSRLKWLADLAALLGEADGQELARLHSRSVALGAGRSAAVALLLCHRLLGLVLPQELRETFRKDRAVRLAARLSMRMMTGSGATELADTRFACHLFRLVALLMLPGWRYRRAEIVRQLSQPVGCALPGVPAALRPFAWPLVAPRAIARNVARALRLQV